MRPLAAALVVVALVGAPSLAQAVGEPVGDLATLAAEAGQLVADERALLSVTDPAVTDSPTQLDAALVELARVDAAGAALLDRLEAIDAPLSPEVRSVLALLPRTPAGTVATVAGSGAAAPDAAAYTAALADLLDLAARPAASAAPLDEPRGVSLETLALVALAFVALGLTGLLFTLRSARPHRELRALVWSDGLTGLANRRCLDRDLDALRVGERVTRSRRPVPGPTAVVMVDIDRFKDINDRYGHRFGDDVLRQVGAALARQVRHDDVVYRYGGEEFCVVLQGATDEMAVRIADRMLAATRQLDFGDGVSVTLSAGVAEGSGDDIEETLHAADQALLAAKRAGRNRTASARTLATATCGT